MCSTKKLLSLLLLSFCVTLEVTASDVKDPLSVVLLSSGSSESLWTKTVNAGIKKSLKQSGQPHVYYTEHLDAGRFDELKQREAMFTFLSQKFDNNIPDIFIAAGPGASSFSLTYSELFPSSKRILIQPKVDVSKENPNVVTIDTNIDYAQIVTEVLRASNPEKVFLIGDSIKPSDKHRLENITQVLNQKNIPYESLNNMDLSSLIKAVSDIPSNNAIFFTPIYRKHEGKGFPPVIVLEELHKVAHVPIFTTTTIEIGFGAVGGYLQSPFELGLMAGDAALNVSHPNIDGIELVYDWNELTRWGYLNKVSDQADVRGKPSSLWKSHKSEFITYSMFLSIFATLSVILFIYSSKLKKARNALSKERVLLERKVEERTKELTNLHKQAEQVARLDELTNICNRRALFESGELVHHQTERTGMPYTFLMVDIDGFKKINDTCGHTVGDRVIKEVAKALTVVSRKSDIVARLGGDEFALILTNTSQQQAIPVAERVRVEVEKIETKLGEKAMRTTVSLGGAVYQLGDQGLASVLERADKALYQAKDAGKNKVVFC